MKKYKFIEIRQEDGEMFDGHPVYRIVNNKSDTELGMLCYYKTWRQYIFRAEDETCVFNISCMHDIIDFMENHAGKA